MDEKFDRATPLNAMSCFASIEFPRYLTSFDSWRPPDFNARFRIHFSGAFFIACCLRFCGEESADMASARWIYSFCSVVAAVFSGFSLYSGPLAAEHESDRERMGEENVPFFMLRFQGT